MSNALPVTLGPSEGKICKIPSKCHICTELCLFTNVYNKSILV